MAAPLDIRVLGRMEVRRGDSPLAIGGPKPRLLLALLVGARGTVVSSDLLHEELWGDDQPSDPGAVLQGNISRLRKLLEPDGRIVARPPGYVLEIDDSVIDAWRFEESCGVARAASDRSVAIDAYGRALSEFGGEPFAEFADREWARAEVTRLSEMHTTIREEHLTARLEQGDERAVVAELEALVAGHPLRERPWELLALALHRCGRSAEALRRIAAFRSILRDELGLDPPAAIQRLEAQILEADPMLDGRPRRPPRTTRLPPAEVTPLVGRSADVAGIVALLGEHRLVTLVGPGGVGKTRVALRVAADVWEAHGGEVHVVELASVHEPLSTIASVATAIDVQQRQHLSVEETLVEYLRGRHALLVLDNCEHLRAAAARLTERLLAACPDLTVLTTSREVLGVPGEHVWRVEPLSIAIGDDPANAPGVLLFVERAIASSPGFVLGPHNIDEVAEIVRRVDGLPLAIELAAARLRALSPSALAERLGRRFELLDHAQLTATERHSTLHELVGWSFNLLNPDEQCLFARLSVFAGSFGLDAVESICSADPLDDHSVARLLAALVDKSMVQLTEPSSGRYRVLEPLRQFARAELVDPEHAAVSERHAEWYLQLAERCGIALSGADEAGASSRLDREFPNLRASFGWAVDRGSVEHGARFVAAMREYSFRSMRAEVISWADDVIAMPGFDESMRSPLVLAVAAYGRFVRGDLDGSIRYSDRSLAASDRLGVGSSGLAERSLGNALFYKGNAQAAQEWIDRLVEDARHGSSARLAHGLYMRSVAFTSVGDTQRGAETAQEALQVARRSGSPTAFAQASYALGLALESSDGNAAATLLQQAAEAAAEAGNRWVQAFALTEVWWLEARRGDPRRALSEFSDVIDLWFRGGDWANQWLSLRHVFGILVQIQEHLAAATLHGALAAVGAAYALPFEASDAQHIASLAGNLRDQLGSADFGAAVRRGASMSDGEIVEFVRDRIHSLSA